MGDLLSGFSQAARDSYEDILRKIADNLSPDAGGTNFTATNNFTIGGNLSVTGTSLFTGNSTLSGLLAGQNAALVSIASIAAANIYAKAATQNALILNSTVLGNATTAPLRLIASAPSQAFFDIQGAVISTASLNLSAGQVAGAVLVRFIGTGGEGLGYLPIFKGVV